MRKSFFIAHILFSLASINGFSQDTSSSLLWKIVGNELKQPSYIFGTIHIIDKSEFIISDSLKKYFSQAKVLAMEIDLNVSLSDKINIAKQTMLPEGKTINEFMKPEEFALLKKIAVDSLQIKEKKFNKYLHLKPFFLSSVLMKDQMKETESYEMAFNKMAKKKKMGISGLESMQYQMNVINSIPIDEQIKMTLDDITNSSQNSDMDELLKTYKSQNIDLIYTYTTSNAEEIPGFLENFIFKRNKNWIPIITSLIEKQSTFIAVGAAHLGGPKGVVQLLREKGYTVTPIIQ